MSPFKNKPAVLILFCLLLAACGGVGKPRPESAIYDFGLSQLPTASTWPAKLSVTDIEAPPGLDSTAIRYRLAYREPARIYAYTLSQWAATPAELLTRRLRQAVGTQQTSESNCSLQISLDVFDHVFESESTSHGTIKLHATLVDHQHHVIVAQTTLSHTQAAPTQNAQGGVMALSMASDAALQELTAWAAATAAAEPSHTCAN